MPSHPANDDLWLAQQYVLGELPTDLMAAFETRLADDPALCQHVADASQLVCTLQAAGPHIPTPAVASPVSVAPTPRRRAAVAAILAAAVCLAVAVLSQREPSLSRGDHGAALKLLSLYRGQNDALRVAAVSDADHDGFDDHAEWSHDQVPSWLIAAVSLERRAELPGQPDDEWEDN
jgi:anti-sigma-K factor RskA